MLPPVASAGFARRARADRGQGGAVTASTTLILSTRGRIIDNAPTRHLVNRITAAGVQVGELPGAHVLEFEPDPSDLYAALTAALADAERTESLATRR